MDEAKKLARKERLKYFLIGGLGALIGGIVVALAMLAVLSWKGGASSNSGGASQRVVVNDLDAATAVEAVAQTVPQSVVGVQASVSQQGFFGTSNGTSTGSGFIVTSDGYVVTNHHVIADGKNIQVSLENGTTYDGDLIWSNEDLDLAVLKIKASDLPVVTLGDSSTVLVGETTVAIGNPMGLEYARSVTSGIVSALNRSLMVDQNMIAEDLIQTDATINAGNSGGPLCNASGEVIGINTYKNYEAEGMGFALPINIVKPIITKIIATGGFKATGIGISAYDAQQSKYYSNVNKIDKGVCVYEVASGSGAAKAGLKAGDIITGINGTAVNSLLEMRAILFSAESGDTVSVTYERGGSSQSVDVTVEYID